MVEISTKALKNRLFCIMIKVRLHIIMLLALLSLVPDTLMAQDRYQVGVCDWMVLKRQKLGEFKLAAELDCDGLEMDMGGLKPPRLLRQQDAPAGDGG